jgi:hypothetical protein
MGVDVVDEVVRSRRKTLALIVQPNGRVVVRAPLRTSQKIVDTFITSKQDWIEKTRKTQLERAKKYPVHHFLPGEQFWYLGKQYSLQIVAAQRPALQFKFGFYLNQKSMPQAKTRFEAWYRQQARLYLSERVNHYASLHHFNFKQVKITSARTRWGSCSGRGTISFTWRLIMAPPEIIDYVVIHELAHTVHHNHSRDFWDLVGKLLPDYATRRKWLKENGHQFYWD